MGTLGFDDSSCCGAGLGLGWAGLAEAGLEMTLGVGGLGLLDANASSAKRSVILLLASPTVGACD